jgi:hypothetical protein
MIKTETMTINGKEFVKTYSDQGYMVEREGVRYSEAIDPVEYNRQYTETDEPIEGYTEEVTAEDYEAALAEMWVEV